MKVGSMSQQNYDKKHCVRIPPAPVTVNMVCQPKEKGTCARCRNKKNFTVKRLLYQKKYLNFVKCAQYVANRGVANKHTAIECFSYSTPIHNNHNGSVSQEWLKMD